jgi:hypothetical protein
MVVIDIDHEGQRHPGGASLHAGLRTVLRMQTCSLAPPPSR